MISATFVISYYFPFADRDNESGYRIRLKKSFVKELCSNKNDQRTSENILQRKSPNIAETLSKGESVVERIEEIENDLYEHVLDKDNIIYRRTETTRGNNPAYVLVQESNKPTVPILQTSNQIVSELSAVSNEILNDDGDYTTLTLWDFAGDEDFYATHQTFLHQNAVYLVVVNLNDKEDKNENNKHGK